MRLNNKGFTIVEVLVTFVLLSIVMISLFSTISTFNEKRIQESHRAKVYEYKNSIVNKIQSDFIEKGLSHVLIHVEGSSSVSTGITYEVYCTLRDGTERVLRVHQRYTKTSFRFDGNLNYSDDFYIEYGTSDEMIREDFPDLGETRGEFSQTVHSFVQTDDSTRCIYDNGSHGPCIEKTFQINNVSISISNDGDLSSESHILSVYIGFFSPDLGTKYAINIVAPIDYQKSASSPTGRFPTGPADSEDPYVIKDLVFG